MIDLKRKYRAFREWQLKPHQVKETVYSIVCDFLCLPDSVEVLTQFTGVIALKQFSGYGWRKTILYSAIAFLLMFITLVILGALFFIAVSLWLSRNS